MKNSIHQVLLVLSLVLASAFHSTSFAGEATSYDGENCRTKGNDELRCLVCAIYTEDHGSIRGMQAVASVIFARVESSQYPDTVCGVVYQPGQFAGVKSRNAKLPSNSSALADVVGVATEALRHPNAGPYLGFRAPIGKNNDRCAKSGSVQIGIRGNCYQHSGEIDLDFIEDLMPQEIQEG